MHIVILFVPEPSILQLRVWHMLHSFQDHTASSYLHVHLYASSDQRLAKYVGTSSGKISSSIYNKDYHTAHLVLKTDNLEEHHPTLTTLIALGRILHRIGGRGRGIRDRASMGEEQDLDGDGQTGVQSNDNDEENAGRLRVDGRDDGVPAGNLC